MNLLFGKSLNYDYATQKASSSVFIKKIYLAKKDR